jgi:hypothetical protein
LYGPKPNPVAVLLSLLLTSQTFTEHRLKPLLVAPHEEVESTAYVQYIAFSKLLPAFVMGLEFLIIED